MHVISPKWDVEKALREREATNTSLPTFPPSLLPSFLLSFDEECPGDRDIRPRRYNDDVLFITALSYNEERFKMHRQRRR